MTLLVFILALLGTLIWLVRALVIFPAYIVSSSMSPTLEIGDIVLVNRLSLRMGRLIKRGDVVVFKDKNGQRCIKRVVGLPGERVAMTNGALTIDGLRVRVEGGNEILCGHPHKVSSVQHVSNPLRAGVCTVPSGHLFMLGDQRDDSKDSRVFGPVRETSILGIVTKLLGNISNETRSTDFS